MSNVPPPRPPSLSLMCPSFLSPIQIGLILACRFPLWSRRHGMCDQLIAEREPRAVTSGSDLDWPHCHMPSTRFYWAACPSDVARRPPVVESTCRPPVVESVSPSLRCTAAHRRSITTSNLLLSLTMSSITPSIPPPSHPLLTQRRHHRCPITRRHSHHQVAPHTPPSRSTTAAGSAHGRVGQVSTSGVARGASYGEDFPMSNRTLVGRYICSLIFLVSAVVYEQWCPKMLYEQGAEAFF
jgi:hypothetical protein